MAATNRKVGDVVRVNIPGTIMGTSIDDREATIVSIFVPDGYGQEVVTLLFHEENGDLDFMYNVLADSLS